MSTYSMQSIPAYPHPGTPFIELEIIADVDSIGSYEWDAFVVLRDPVTGMFHTIEGSGCSCDGLWSGVQGLTDLEGPFTFHQAAEKAQAWEGDEGSNDACVANRRAGLGAQVVEALVKATR